MAKMKRSKKSVKEIDFKYDFFVTGFESQNIYKDIYKPKTFSLIYKYILFLNLISFLIPCRLLFGVRLSVIAINFLLELSILLYNIITKKHKFLYIMLCFGINLLSLLFFILSVFQPLES